MCDMYPCHQPVTFLLADRVDWTGRPTHTPAAIHVHSPTNTTRHLCQPAAGSVSVRSAYRDSSGDAQCASLPVAGPQKQKIHCMCRLMMGFGGVGYVIVRQRHMLQATTPYIRFSHSSSVQNANHSLYTSSAPPQSGEWFIHQSQLLD